MKKVMAIAVLMVAALTDAAVAADISTLTSGTYFAQGSMYARSYRVFGKENGRACVKIVDGPPNPYEGYQNITVSTIADTDSSAPGEKSAIAPTPKPAVQYALLIVPGKSVGQITKQTDRQGLVTMFGAANVEDFIQYGPEGIGEFPATRVKIGGKESLRVIWKDTARQQLGSIEIFDSRWHLADGLAVDMTVAALQKQFGKFEFYGFGWDYGGTVISENNPKLDKYRKSTGVNFTLGVPSVLCQQFQADCRSVSGDSTFSSDNPRLKSLKPRIEVLYVRL